MLGAPVDADPVQRFAGEADWVSAGGDIPEGYLAWIEAAEARGERVPAVPLTPAVDGGRGEEGAVVAAAAQGEGGGGLGLSGGVPRPFFGLNCARSGADREGIP
jgi:hypothetical protein